MPVTDIQKDDVKNIRCIGSDNRQHLCLPWENTCLCGITVIRKKMLRDDWMLYSCWDCTY